MSVSVRVFKPEVKTPCGGMWCSSSSLGLEGNGSLYNYGSGGTSLGAGLNPQFSFGNGSVTTGLTRHFKKRAEIGMYIGRPIQFEIAPAPFRNRFRFQLALVVFVLLAVAGPVVLGRLLASSSTGEIPAFIGP